MTTEQLDQLARRANQAGFVTIPDHYEQLIKALEHIANTNSGWWGWVAHDALAGEGHYAPEPERGHAG